MIIAVRWPEPAREQQAGDHDSDDTPQMMCAAFGPRRLGIDR
jgi:hypothetical protein